VKTTGIMKILLSTIIILIANILYGQHENVWLENLENPKYPSEKLKIENAKLEYLEYDFSTLLTPRRAFLGFIGEDFQRIRIYFTSISKDITNQENYIIKGLSIVKSNKCDFEGIITVTQVREFETMHYGVDNKYEHENFISQGVLIGEYELKENPAQNHSGIFEGLMSMYWYLDKDGVIHYDKIQWFSDNYKNNQYIGTWKSYEGATNKVCNWGEYRIPFSGDLDIGTAEFFLNPKYFKNGWEDFKRQ
jgi:hypothetical protein